MPPPKAKGGKMLGLINWRLKITINDGRALVGQMLAFDRHMNLVLADCEEFRRVRPKRKPGEEPAPEQEMKRALGLVILRGETVVSLSVEGPPPVVEDDKKNALPVGPGRGMPAGRGMGMMPMGMPGMGRPPMPFPPPGMPGPPPGFRPPGMPPGMPFPPPPGFGGPPPGFQPPP
ncbi:hypothetical protein R3P38DRAFT_2930522 [Favolaschia claudopus]|uniref:Sm protein B n=1 Tax=Favolaschia claudopus TaxID=2862362 RepID=A0AAW0BUJ3_9AGAR